MCTRSLSSFAVVVLLAFVCNVDALRRCVQCRSRGDLGTCRDPFIFNGTTLEFDRGVSAVPCASGWCGKMIESGSTYNNDDYGAATQRMCLQRGPSDDEERCAPTVWNRKKVFMCFCLGDLCNGAQKSGTPNILSFISITLVILYRYL